MKETLPEWLTRKLDYVLENYDLSDALDGCYSECFDHCGASKGVMSNSNDSDYVYKIPFRAYDGYENGGAYICDMGNGWDYCYLESEVYKRAKSVGLEKFFAKTEFVCEYNGLLVYRQEKIRFDTEHIYSIEEKRNSARILNKNDIEWALMGCRNWLTAAFDYYTEDEVVALAAFIEEYNIGDIGDGNCGYNMINGAPIISDYSDYND